MKNAKRVEELCIRHLKYDLELYFGRKEVINESYQENIIKYLLSRNLISQQEATYYVVLKEIQNLVYNKVCSKTQAVLRVSAELEISERNIWGILKNHQHRFCFKFPVICK